MKFDKLNKDEKKLFYKYFPKELLTKNNINESDWNNCDLNYIHEYAVKSVNSEESIKSIYHYTNLEALVNIINTNTLWATNCAYLCAYLDDLQELKDIEKTYDYLMKTDNELDKKLVEVTRDILIKNVHEKHREQTYVISFSKVRDSIAMWKVYGKNGIVLEFDASEMKNFIMKENIFIYDKNNKKRKIGTGNVFGQVIYDDSEIIKLFKASINQYKRIKSDKTRNELMENYIQGILIKTLHQMFYLKKDFNFNYENEYRMAFILYDNDINKVENFKVKNGMIIPYLIIDFNNKGKIPLKSITINPEQKDYMFETSIKHFLKTNNYDIPIYYSNSRTR